MKTTALALALAFVATVHTDVYADPVEKGVDRESADSFAFNHGENGLIAVVIISPFGDALSAQRKAASAEEANNLIAVVIITALSDGLSVQRKIDSTDEESGLSGAIRWVDPVLLFELMGLGLSWEQAVALLAQ